MTDRESEAGSVGVAPAGGLRAYNRRLADKVGEALKQAEEQGRQDVVERLRKLHDEILESDARGSAKRRAADPRT